MGGKGPIEDRLIGRFDQSFFVRMTSSFLVLLAAIAFLELGLRYAALAWDFRSSGEEDAHQAAGALAADVTSIMLNSGGPVASRTIYPILDRTFRRAGMHVAIEPSPVTVSSIEERFSFTPRGIPAAWPGDGPYREGRVELRAEDFCLQCHGHASVGDVLGAVTVRRYFDEQVAEWWEEVRLSVTLNLAKVVVHTVVLFFLLRTLMEPLLGLRAALSNLARGAAGLSTRAEIRSHDEFGSLARDLNAFLDRVDQILHDFGRTLARMADVNGRLAAATGAARARATALEEVVVRAVAGAGVEVGRARETGGAAVDPQPAGLDASLPRLVHGVHDLRHALDEIGHLEEHLAEVAADGRALHGRLVGELDDAAATGDADTREAEPTSSSPS